MSDTVSFRFEGRPIAASAGMSIGAALAAAGEHRLRETRSGEQRGLFCGMGVCQDCLVTVDGSPGHRACVTKAAPGLDVRRHGFPGALPDCTRGAPPIGIADLPSELADVVVIGGGAGGLNAALTARRGGLDVLLLDERPVPGGQYFKQMGGDLPPLDAQQREGRSLRSAAESAGVRIRDGAEVWSPLDGLAVLATVDGRTFVARGRVVIMATGAYERPHPVPGWTLPGVMTTGAMQTLWRSYRALPGRRILIGGNGPLNLQVATELMDGGAEVVAVVESAPLMAPGRLPDAARMAFADGALTRRGLSLVGQARAGGAKLRFGQVIRGIRAGREGLVVETGRPTGGPAELWTVDAVAMGYGFLPSNELLRALAAEHRYDSPAGMLRTLRDIDCETSVEGLFAVGDCAGLGGAPAALAEGVIAGAAAVKRLGGQPEKDRLAQARRDLARHRRFQQALWSLYAAPRPGLALADDDTLVCRCEEVTKREIMAAVSDGGAPIGAIKRRTRCGMGRCQGRYCGPLLVEELSRRTGADVTERDFFAPRGPAKPVRIRDLVGGATGET
jgi:D-hydroxyproline dehydrogenase subunit alpha